jgi:para-nitrobenzyl esterase
MARAEARLGESERARRPALARGALTGDVPVTGGRIAGLTGAGDLRVFLGIPFAAPPVGTRRWRPPEAVEPWDGARAATRFAARPVQPAIAPSGALPSLQTLLFFPPIRHGQSEDCLYANVWTTARPGDGRAVMVWIYGGGFRAGETANPLYDGSALAREGVVVVSIAYRVWKFGFLAHPELTAESPHRVSGNYGLLDQIAALRWVQENIEQFGGDPENVTIFGQSAGAASACYLTVSPLAKGLFARVVAQSGGAFFDDAVARSAAKPLAEAEREGADWLARRGGRSIADLRALRAEELLEDVREGFRSSLPIVDGHAIIEPPSATFARGAHNDVPLLTGSNADEGTVFAVETTLAAYVAGARAAHGARADHFLRLYPAHDDDSAAAAVQDVLRDVTFARQNWAWANAQATHGRAPAYYYRFAHPLPVEHAAYIENRTRPVGATHGSEIPYVFGTTGALTHAEETDRVLSRMLMRYWVNFAIEGDPNVPGLAEWPRFDPALPRVMELKPKPEIVPIPHAAELAFWSI